VALHEIENLLIGGTAAIEAIADGGGGSLDRLNTIGGGEQWGIVD
jgi:hypothetical protein